MTRKRISKIHRRSQHPEIPHSIRKTIHSHRPVNPQGTSTFQDKSREVEGAKKMRVEQSIHPEPKHVYKVSGWKTKPDPTAPWWQRWFHRFIYLPFQNFSITVMKVPPLKQMIEETDAQGNTKRTFGWFEDLAIFEHEAQADEGCLVESDFYTRLPYGRLMPAQSAQYKYGCPTFPRKKDPKKWVNPVLSLVIKDRDEDERKDKQMAGYLAQLHEILDRQ